MPLSIAFTVPAVPPSVNHYVKHTRTGRHYVTGEGTAFKEWVGTASRGMQIRWESYGVMIHIFLGAGQKGDIDNFPKCVLDGLKDYGVIDSDARVTRLVLEKFRDIKNPRTFIEIWAR